MINFNGRGRALVRKIESNPYYRFQNAVEINIGASLGIKIDVNQATVDDWLRLPGISITQARNLVEMTTSGIQFLCLEDLAAALGVSVSRIMFWQPLLSFAYYDQNSFHEPSKINPNTASVEQLMAIPNLDQSLAMAIIEQRQSIGNYRNLVDLQRRLNLKPDFVYHLMYYFQFN
ncbi:MAG: ComEA family DNA-binding protein [Cyanobacterium sp. T60_A2020_053]|nr:ComEA family DNA-binding protein [Cyanobacterium sp. T60_A2020_053]